MKIKGDNIKVDLNKSFEAGVLKENALVLKPSQAVVYLGNYQIQQMANRYDGSEGRGRKFRVFGTDTLSGREWSIIDYHGYYRYVLSESIDLNYNKYEYTSTPITDFDGNIVDKNSRKAIASGKYDLFPIASHNPQIRYRDDSSTTYDNEPSINLDNKKKGPAPYSTTQNIKNNYDDMPIASHKNTLKYKLKNNYDDMPIASHKPANAKNNYDDMPIATPNNMLKYKLAMNSTESTVTDAEPIVTEEDVNKVYANNIEPETNDDLKNIIGDSYQFSNNNGIEDNPKSELPPDDFDSNDLLGKMLKYDLLRNETNETRHISYINRFKFMTEDHGAMSTKSFIFMTRPDLNIWNKYTFEDGHEGELMYRIEADRVDETVLNPDINRIPIFHYIKDHNKLESGEWGIGAHILRSLEYYGTTTTTPWLSIITNQATSYQPMDRAINTIETPETLHGSKILYGKGDWKHSVAGTITIDFVDREDLALYYTLKAWCEYINAVFLGTVRPLKTHIDNAELDYAVSLFYVTTDVTMENIVYWEKLTGLFPLKVPDSIFDWAESPEKELKYSIDFAYSMREVMDVTDLNELNAIYEKDIGKSSGSFPSYISERNPYTSNDEAYFKELINYFNTDKNSSPEVPKAPYGFQEQYQFNNNMLDFYANYLPKQHIHGIPYVNGPYIVKSQDNSNGNFKLKWV